VNVQAALPDDVELDLRDTLPNHPRRIGREYVDYALRTGTADVNSFAVTTVHE
jgi:hypothetical protein